MMMTAALLAVAALSCPPASAQDVQAQCARTGNDDRVRPLPSSLIPNARRIFELEAEMPDSDVRATSSFRCMNGAAWLCNAGANLICGKADTSRVSPGAEQFCRQNPGSTDIPMSVTGHATVYEWTCAGRKARIVGQTTGVDARGFIAGNWKKLE
jgi:hypothetical protein